MEREITRTIILVYVELLFLLGFLVFAATVQFLACPVCYGEAGKTAACAECGHDGKVTLLQYIAYYVKEALSASNDAVLSP